MNVQSGHFFRFRPDEKIECRPGMACIVAEQTDNLKLHIVSLKEITTNMYLNEIGEGCIKWCRVI